MQPTLESLGIDRMGIDDRIALATAIWDSIADASHQESLLNDTQKAELDRRLAEHEAHPDDVIPWETVRADTLSRIQR